MSAVTVLRKVRDILRAKKHWTQGAFAKDENGLMTHFDDPNAVCFCIIGALHKAYRTERWNDEARDFIRNCIAPEKIIRYNDNPERKHSEIVATLNAAIKLALAKEKAAKRTAKTK